MTSFIYDWPLLRRAGRLQWQAFGLLPEPTLFLLRAIAAGAFQDTAPDRVLLVAAMGYIGEEMGCCCSGVYMWVLYEI
jgi:hypothetical protein